MKLFAVFLGGSAPKSNTELHANTFLVATGEAEAKARAKAALLQGLLSVHTDDIYDVDDCLEIGQVAGLHVALSRTDEPERFEPQNGFLPLPAPVIEAWVAQRRA